ncbi:MAG: hypothetical protein LBD14_06025 [Puniceicoccales bacterium]|jgi:hypothetical protein|nr:hypothetical protein [Puniceicoccales bacterium]
MLKRFPCLAAVLGGCFLALAGFSGCGTGYEKDATALARDWSRGDYAAAADLAGKKSSAARTTDRLLWQLEWGAATRAAGRLDESVRAFDSALESISKWDRTPDASLSGETLAALTNMNALPYRGTAYDRIMLSTYQALNYLALGRRDKARVALNLAQDRQAEAVQANAARLERITAAQGADVERTRRDAGLASALDATYAETRRMKAYADYVNPFSVWLHGVFFLANATGASDIERAHKSLERAAAMAPNDAVREDLAMARKLRSTAAELSPTTYIIFETGLAPTRREVRMDIPLLFVTGKVPYVGAAFPKLQFHENHAAALSVWTLPDRAPPVRTQTLARMDGIVATDFDNELPEIVTRTLLSTLLKAAISYGVNEAADRAVKNKSDGTAVAAWLASRLATTVYGVATTNADLRTWHTLPKEFQIARLPTPPSRRLRLVLGNSPAVDILLNTGTVGVVYVKSTARDAPPAITQFTLKP